MKTKVLAKTVVLNPEKHVLLLQRSSTDERRPGQLDYPGGQVDDGEEPTAGACREAYEEAGLTLAPKDLSLVYAATEFYEDAAESVTRLLFVVHVEYPAIVLSHEHDDYQWLPVEEAIKAFPHPFYGVGLRYAMDHDLLD